MAMGGGTLATMSAVGMMLGSTIGSVVGNTLFSDKGGGASMPSAQAPGTPSPPQMPGAPGMEANPNAPSGAGPALTAEEIVRGQAQQESQRRGRLSTILSQTNLGVGEPTNETLG
jgi:hypothetical protein